MTTNTNSFSGFVSTMVATIQGYAAGLVDMAPGSVLLALAQAVAGVLLWLQAQLLSVLATTRAATSKGADLDSWMADYGFARLPGSAATGALAFTRYTASAGATLLVTGTLEGGVVSGTAVAQSADGARQYAVLADSGNAYWNAALGTLGGYSVPAGVAQLAVPVGCLATGSAGNVAAGQLNTLATALPGWDACTNAAALANGSDAEADAALRLRFVDWIASLSKATRTAVAEAVSSVQDNVSFTITENLAWPANTPAPGYFYVIADDGSGNPGSDFLQNVAAAVEAVRPLGVRFNVYGPLTTTATVYLRLTLDPDYDAAATRALVQGAISDYIAALPLGAGLPLTRLAQLAYDASPAVLDVGDISLNGSGTSSLPGVASQLIRPWSFSVASVAVADGGSGYAAGDVLTLAGGSATTPARLTVSGVSGGVITALTLSDGGRYASLPPLPAALTGGGGSGARVNLGNIRNNSVVVA